MQFNRCFGCMEEIQGRPCPHCGFDPEKEPSANYALACGMILNGRYVVGKMLGQGGFGITYIGFDLVLQRKIAIKEYFPQGQVGRITTVSAELQWFDSKQASDLRERGMRAFLREARKMAKIGDVPEVVRVLECFQENGTAYIVMDFVDGKTLTSVLEETGIMTWERAEAVFLPAIRAMEEVHREGMIHRDISPDNLMLTQKGVRILDLGAAKDVQAGPGASSSKVVKHGFSPLEQYTQQGGSGPWTDVYAMAATMYYALTGVLPPAALDRLDRDTIDWSLLKGRGVPGTVIDALRKAMALTPGARTQSMTEFLHQLQRKPGHTPAPAAARYAATGVLVVLLLAGLFLGSRRSPETGNSTSIAAPSGQTVESLPAQNVLREDSPGERGADGDSSAWPAFGGSIARKDVLSIAFVDTLEGAGADAWDVSRDGNGAVMAWTEKNGSYYNLFIGGNGGVLAPENCSGLFGEYDNLQKINFNGAFRTDGVTDLSNMFAGCRSLQYLELDFLDTSSVNNLSGMFSGCSSMRALDLSGMDTSRVTDMSFLFSGCKYLSELDVSGFDTGNVTSMTGMFSGCSSLKTLDVSGFDTRRVTSMSGMFSGCDQLTGLDLSGFDISRAEDIESIAELYPGAQNLGNVVPGSLLELGAYEQDNNTVNGAEPIRWLVLARDGNEALVISVLGLDTLPYEDTQKTADWESCSLRAWLNGTFYEEAFSQKDKAQIATKEIVQHPNKGYPSSNQGDNTVDHVFLLSAEEYSAYLYDNETIDAEYQCGTPSEYCKGKKIDLYNDKYCWWWLRTASKYNQYACNATAYGSLDYGSSGIHDRGGLVRPAMWIRVT